MSQHAMPFGAETRSGGLVRFRLWAPSHANVSVEIDHGAAVLALQRRAGGWHEIITDRAQAGSLYYFILPDGSKVPDPASRFQPDDVHGPSEVIDPTKYEWRDSNWRGRDWQEAVVYELHVGAFSHQGTFRAAIEKLDHLVHLGVTAIELMPVADFAGSRNWGYDGVALYAPDSTYGCPDALRALVDAAHERQVMVLLDVVYNHFGPEGAYIYKTAPETFTNRHKTPWGAAINTDSADSGTVRAFFIHNALYWLHEFHLDGLRLDAVHAILDDSPKHLLEELAERVRSEITDREVHLILENEENESDLLARNEHGQPRWYTAQWNDDVHHVLHVAATGEAQGYYGDYQADSTKLGRALAQGFAFQGEYMPYRGGPRGQPSADLSPAAFVAFIQNHDQIGNRAFGDRITSLASPEAVRAVAAVYLLLPQIPMLFMGEEWGTTQPFPFFCDFEPELAQAVRKGRREEFARFPEFQDPQKREQIPDPTAVETFLKAKLNWEELQNEPHSSWFKWYRDVLQIRRQEILPRLKQLRRGGDFRVIGPSAVIVCWSSPDDTGEELRLEANLSSTPVTLVTSATSAAQTASAIPTTSTAPAPSTTPTTSAAQTTPAAAAAPAAGLDTAKVTVLWQEGSIDPGGRLGPYSVRWSVRVPRVAAKDTRDSSLERLADRMGILPEYRNARGDLVPTTQEIQRKLLAAMGVRIDECAETATALEAVELETWRQPLPPVRVVRDDQQHPTVDVVLPAELQTLQWSLRLEDGTHQQHTVDVHSLEPLETRTVEGHPLQRRRLVLTNNIPCGYHHLGIEPGGGDMTLIVTPAACWVPPAFHNQERLWGIATQLYLLRSPHNWGIGDFGDLLRLVKLGAESGADVIGLNPLHVLLENEAEHASPYSPASRLLLNVLNIDVQALMELESSPEAKRLLQSKSFQEKLAACRSSQMLDYATVAELKRQALTLLFNSSRAQNGERWASFQQFRRERAPELEKSCQFLALREHLAGVHSDRLAHECEGRRSGAHNADWHNWPAEYQLHDSPAVAAFAREHAADIEFRAWLQWIAETQLGAASRASAEHGMRIGIYRDLAVGADRAGAETWTNPNTVVSGAQVGAPPDILNPAGQNWGLPPFNPHALRAEAYQSFIQLLRANMRFAGALRLDHAMGLQQLYWVPQSSTPREGAYVRYPLEDLIGIVALESHRHQCLVIGEDLGTVPEGFREAMQSANILSYRVLFFEQNLATGEFLPPEAYPPLSLAVVGNHDLPTLDGWWLARDLDVKERLGLFPDPGEASCQHALRDRDKRELLQALRRESLIPADTEPNLDTLSRAVHAFLAKTNSALVMAQLDDITGETEQVNVPATASEHPNWRRRLSLTLEEIAASPRFSDLKAVFARERSRHQPPQGSTPAPSPEPR